MTEVHAVLWDMDGTLVDTEPFWIASEFALAEKYGGTWSEEHALALVGNDLRDSASYIAAHMLAGTGAELTGDEIVEELLDGVVTRVAEAVPWRPGARELLGELAGAGVPCALVTMSWQRLVDPVLAALPPETFRVVVTGDRVDRGKPHPEPYLTAAARLGLAPTDCVALEDSETGARSAEAAGCRVVVVPHHVAVPAGPGRQQVAGLDELDLDGLARLARV